MYGSKDRLAALFSTDAWSVAILASSLILLGFGVVKACSIVADKALQVDAESTSLAVVTSLAHSLNDLPAILAGRHPSDQTWKILKLASEANNAYRYKIWDRNGNLVFQFDRGGAPFLPMTIAGRHGKKTADSILAGSTFSEAKTGRTSHDPAYFAESYIPIVENGAVIGVFEAYLDMTDDKAIFSRAVLVVEIVFSIAVLVAGGIPGWLVFRKMQDIRRARAEALFLADHDSLTGVANRHGLEETALGALELSRRNKSVVAVLLIDLNHFKEINDSFGHATGDRLLKAFANRLKSSVRADDVVARFGGDEFVVLQLGLAQPRGAKVLADRLIRILSAPYDIGGTSLNCGVTIGIAVAPTDADNWDQLLSRADAALYKAKDGGRNSVCFFTSGMDAIFKQRTNLEVELRRALESKSFNLAYQPLFSFHDESLTGFECLLRWPQNWLFRSPADFIPVAEESGLIVPIGEWILITACRTAAAWDNHLKIAVNISPVQFRQGDLVGIVERALAISGLVPNRLELEVTESLWLQDSDTVLDQLSRLRSLGVSIALDDFGTGYSSLAYLWRFPFDKVKIDRSFVAAIQSDPKALAIVQTIVAMAKALNLTVTAEGVETEEQARALREAGCDQVQGFFYGRPLSLAVAEEIVEIQSQLRRSLRLARNT